MADLNPEGISQSDNFFGQKVRLKKNDVVVDTGGNERAFATPQGQTGVGGSTGVVSAVQGSTGVAYFGATGIRGITGIAGDTGIIGLQGETGSLGIIGLAFGVTGLQGATGVASTTTGITGDTGIRGSTGITGSTGSIGVGAQGETGVGLDFQGATGITGENGPNIQLQGVTGLPGLGATGIAGDTGLIGNTGASGTRTIGVVSGDASSLSALISANTILANQQIDFSGIGFTADDDNPTTFSLTLGSTTVFTKEFGLLSDVCRLTGTIISVTTTSQVIGLQLVFDSGTTHCVSVSTTEDFTLDQLLIFAASSGGEGAAITQFSAVEIAAPV